MRLLFKGWFVFSQPLRLLVALSGIVVAANILLIIARDSGRLLYFGRVIFYLFLFFPSTDFSTSLSRFSRNLAIRRGNVLK